MSISRKIILTSIILGFAALSYGENPNLPAPPSDEEIVDAISENTPEGQLICDFNGCVSDCAQEFVLGRDKEKLKQCGESCSNRTVCKFNGVPLRDVVKAQVAEAKQKIAAKLGWSQTDIGEPVPAVPPVTPPAQDDSDGIVAPPPLPQ